eukprot:Plantae.Rhodophyta-Rhodochaete_pulchella.ctg7754.p1 GENE.Plantae.Rhodophyta-Rhodochaete_pulchella.ctg7754~~Plantae.Rhodophyta-Rhodochaete_pulchella.ctg7754.p1  ORF type:complete len:222 (+),score=13.62 Plantae.Rhodophyta-Rhodochaete_pulchella.ctg7754:147-812(+)
MPRSCAFLGSLATPPKPLPTARARICTPHGLLRTHPRHRPTIHPHNVTMQASGDPSNDQSKPSESDRRRDDETLRTSVGLIARTRILFLNAATFLGFRQSEHAQSAVQRLRSYGVAAVISYGLFDLLTYTVSFFIALRGFKASTGKSLSRATFPQVFALCWGINNFSRPLRIAGALFMAPAIDKYVVKPFRRVLRPAGADTETAEEEQQPAPLQPEDTSGA